jgi:3'(2'), 5'-bisphosphate nucleotidase
MELTAQQLLALQTPVIELARLAGEEILEVYETAFEVTRKADKSPVTEADMGAHRIIDAGLARLIPELPVLSEEGANIDYATRSEWQTYWLIDPLDGTREFVKRNGEFSVNIALIDNHRSVLGVVYAPVLKRLYYASAGNGAYKQEAETPVERIAARTISGEKITVAGSRSHSDARLMRYLDRLGEHTLISIGSSLKACLVAEGKADLYPRLGPTSEWDTAAAQCVVEEAGGAITTIDMLPLRYNTKASLLNPNFFAFGDKSRDWSRFL